jgi:hypothetical protein
VIRFSESVVEDAALVGLESLGWAIKHRPGIAPGNSPPGVAARGFSVPVDLCPSRY